MTSIQLAERLTEYGADMKSAAERFLDDYDLYAVCLKDFLDGNRAEALVQALSAEDYQSAFEISHEMKGVSGNLGLDPLYKVVCEFVDALRAKNYESLNQLYDAVLSAVNELKALVQD